MHGAPNRMATNSVPTREQLRRLGECLEMNRRELASVDPELSFIVKFLGDLLREDRPLEAFHTWAVSRQAAPIASHAPSLPVEKPTERLWPYEQNLRARDWYTRRESEWPDGEAPPSLGQDWLDAQREIPGVARRYIERNRPIAWRLRRGEKPKKRKSP